MNEISTQTVQLPDSLPDLSKFALIGREKLNAVRAEIRAIEKVGLAKEVHEQKLLEAQEIAEAVLDAEAKIGELTAKIPKAQGQRNDVEHIRNGAEKSKQSQLAEIGIKQDTAERFERLAKHPQEVQEAKETARQEGRIVTRQDVFNTIRTKKNKTPAQAKKEFIESVKKEHENFESQKGSRTVEFSSIKEDKENKRILATDMWLKCMKIGAGIDNMTIDSHSGEVDLKLMADNLAEEKMQTLREAFNRWLFELPKIYKEIFNE